MRLALLSVVFMACGPSWVWSLPKGFPAPAVPADNPMSVEKVELGRRLFFDKQLSRNGQQACSSCHEQARAFTDGRVHSEGSTGQAHRRNAQGLANVAYVASLTWANPLVTTLERQALLPLLGETPVELGWSGHEDELVARLAADGDYSKRFSASFPGERSPVSLKTITYSIAAYERTLISGASAYDRAVAGDAAALSEPAQRGQALFNSERLECYHCHAGFTFSDSVTHAGTKQPEKIFNNTGLYDLDRQGSYPTADQGVFEVTNAAPDMGRFRAPSLRNLAFTAPYMHDGSMATLDEVLDAYAAGGRARAQHGTPNPLQSELVRGFTLTTQERADLLAFLDALNDPSFVSNPALGPP